MQRLQEHEARAGWVAACVFVLAAAGAAWGADMAPASPAAGPVDATAPLPDITGGVGQATAPPGPESRTSAATPPGPLPLAGSPAELLQLLAPRQPDAPAAPQAVRDEPVVTPAPLPTAQLKPIRRPARDEPPVELVSPDDLDRIDWEPWVVVTLIVMTVAFLLLMLARLGSR